MGKAWPSHPHSLNKRIQFVKSVFYFIACAAYRVWLFTCLSKFVGILCYSTPWNIFCADIGFSVREAGMVWNKHSSPSNRINSAQHPTNRNELKRASTFFTLPSFSSLTLSTYFLAGLFGWWWLQKGERQVHDLGWSWTQSHFLFRAKCGFSLSTRLTQPN